MHLLERHDGPAALAPRAQVGGQVGGAHLPHVSPRGVRRGGHQGVMRREEQVGGALGVELERAGPIACGHDLVALEGKGPLERRADSTVVFGDQDPVHARTFPRLGEKSVRWVAMRTS